jgi:hypothetical protein
MSEREYDAERDTWASWWDAHYAIGEMVKAGRPLPEMFKERSVAKQQVRQRKPTNDEAAALRMIARSRLIKTYVATRREPVWIIEGGREISDYLAKSLIKHGWVTPVRDGLSMFDDSQTYLVLTP